MTENRWVAPMSGAGERVGRGTLRRLARRRGTAEMIPAGRPGRKGRDVALCSSVQAGATQQPDAAYGSSGDRLTNDAAGGSLRDPRKTIW